MGGRENIDLFLLADDLTGQGVEGVDSLNLVPKELDSDGVLFVHGDNLNRIAPHPEGTPVEVQVIAGILHGNELGQQLVPV